MNSNFDMTSKDEPRESKRSIVTRWVAHFLAICDFELANSGLKRSKEVSPSLAPDDTYINTGGLLKVSQTVAHLNALRKEHRKTRGREIGQTVQLMENYLDGLRRSLGMHQKRGSVPMPDSVLFEVVRILDLVERVDSEQRQLWKFLSEEWPLWFDTNYEKRKTRAKDGRPWRLPVLPNEFSKSSLTDLKESCVRTLTMPLEKASRTAERSVNHVFLRKQFLEEIRRTGEAAFSDGPVSLSQSTIGEALPGDRENSERELVSYRVARRAKKRKSPRPE